MSPTSFALPGFSARRNQALIAWLGLCFAASLSELFISTEGWYVELQKPAWSSSPWIIDRTWTLLYGLMGIAAWLVWCEGGWRIRRWALGLFLLQLLLNALWAPLFFGLRLPGLAFGEVLALWLVLVATLIAFWRVRKGAGILLIPYLGWLSLIVHLNFTLWQLNP